MELVPNNNSTHDLDFLVIIIHLNLNNEYIPNRSLYKSHPEYFCVIKTCFSLQGKITIKKAQKSLRMSFE